MYRMRDEEMNIPHLFRCPISLDLFEDPVTLCTGQTYDRSNIEKWLKAGNLTCPVTMQKLQDPSLIPNHTLQHLIRHWLCMDNRFNPEDAYKFDSDLSLVMLRHDIESRESTFKTRIEALKRIRSLSEELEWRKTRLVKLGYFDAVLKLVFRFSLVEAKLSQEDSEVAEESLHCLLNLLPFSDTSSLHMLKESSHLAMFQVLLEQGSAKMKTDLCSLIEAVTASLKTRELCSALGQTQPLVRRLLDLASGNAEASEAANKAILSLCSLESNRDHFIKEGAVESLVSQLSNLSRRNQASVALTTLELLLESDTARNNLGKNTNGVCILVKMVFGVCFDHKESEAAVSSLLSVCYESAKAREEAISAGVLTQLLLLLQSQCSSRAKSKARMLLKLFRTT